MAQSARAQIRETVRDRITGEEEISVPQITSGVLTALMDDEQFMQAFTNETLRDAVHREVQSVVAASRDLTLFGDTAMTEQALAKRSAAFARRFLGWYEHVGERHLNLMKMDRDDLLVAASERRKRGNTELHLAVLWTQLADGMEDGQSVEERFSVEEIESLYGAIHDAQQEGAA